MIPGKKYAPEDYLRIVWRYRWAAFVPFIVVTAATLAALHFIPNTYRADTLILVVPQRVPESYVKATVTTKIEDRLQSISQQILSRTRLERIIQDFDLYARERRTDIMEDVVERMRRQIGVQMVKGDAFRVSYMARDPRTAMKVTERLASLFIEENLRDRELLADATNQFLETQLEDARQRLEEHEHKLEEYRRRFTGQLPSQLQSNLQVLQNAQLNAQALVDSVNRDRDQLLVMERSIAAASQPGPDEVSAAPATSSGDPQLTGTSPEAQLEAARRTLASIETRYTSVHPDVIRMKKLIAQLEQRVRETPAETGPAADAAAIAPVGVNPATAARLRRLHDLKADHDVLDRQIAEKEARQASLQREIQEYQSRVAAAPTRESELVALTRDYDTLRKVYTDLLAKREESKVAANLERRQIGEQFRILDAAQLPEKPFSPNRPMIAGVGALAGLAVGAVLVALLEYRDVKLRTEADVSAVLNLPVLAAVPRHSAVTPRARASRILASCAAGAALVAIAVGMYLTLAARL